MTAPLYVVVLPVSITLCIIADRTPNLRPVYLCAVLCVSQTTHPRPQNLDTSF